MVGEVDVPKGLDIKSFYVSVEGVGYVVVEAATAQALFEGLAPWAGIAFDYKVVPIVSIEEALAGLHVAIAYRAGA